jgi:hypothetical protein
MSDRKRRFRQATAVPRGLMEGMTEIARDAAKQNDAGTLGVDGWIRAGHQMIDLGMRAYASLFQALVAGPWWAAPPAGEPEPSEPIEVGAQRYPRKFTIVKPFVRVGIPRMRIPDHAIRFEPEELPAGASEFRIALRDSNFVGATYKATVRLSPAAAVRGAKADEPFEVTVGL